ncbi:MAG: Kae1-associated kinase Bud32 [Thermofilum sp. ex4484_79]|nr:MAG: Kae1-associated kinase Bud32 [Thermofilum sp. ex4484_79]
MEERINSLIEEIRNIKRDLQIERVLGIGAEAVIVLSRWMEFRVVAKYRYSKRYRDPKLDKILRRKRTVNEAKVLVACKNNGIPVPSLLYLDDEQSLLLIEYIEGKRVRDFVPNREKNALENLFMKIGEYVGMMHAYNIIHGDLTLSNILLVGDMMFFIDFGLSEFSNELEKQGVDVHILMRAIENMWPLHSSKLIEHFFKGYEKVRGLGTTNKVKLKVTEIRKRGRYIAERRKE